MTENEMSDVVEDSAEATEELWSQWVAIEQEREEISESVAEKARRYVDHPSEAPEGVDLQEGPKGGLYYETEGTTEEPPDSGEDVHHHTYEEYERLLDEGTIPRFTPPGYEMVGNSMDEAAALEVGQEVIAGGRASVRGTITEVDGGNITIESTLGTEEIVDITSVEFKASDAGDRPRGTDFESLDELFESGYFSFANGSTDQNGAQQAVWKEWMSQKHGVEQLQRAPIKADYSYTWSDSMVEWRVGGYWMSSCYPIWKAAQELSEGDPPIPDDITNHGPDKDYLEGVDEVMKDTIRSCQEYVRTFITGDEGTITVKRGIDGDLAEQAIKARESGEPLEIDPRAMESWTLDDNTAEKYAGVVIEREINVEDVAFYGPLVMPPLSGVEEITTLGNGPYEISPDNIKTKEEHYSEREGL